MQTFRLSVVLSALGLLGCHAFCPTPALQGAFQSCNIGGTRKIQTRSFGQSASPRMVSREPESADLSDCYSVEFPAPKGMPRMERLWISKPFYGDEAVSASLADCYEIMDLYTAGDDVENSDDVPLIRDLLCKKRVGMTPLDAAQPASLKRDGDAALFADSEASDDLPLIRDLISQKRAGMTPLPEAKKRDADKELFSDATAMLGQLSSADLNDCYAPMEWNTPKKPSLASTHRLWTGKPLVRHDVSSASMADCYQAIGVVQPSSLGRKDFALIRDLLCAPQTVSSRKTLPVQKRDADAALFK